MTHDEYLKLIGEKADEALEHPFIQLMDDAQKALFRIAFLNGCHAMRDYYQPIVETLESDVQHYVELENGEST